MRNSIILILALFAGTAFAQAPVIDSMLIDESKGILSVYGDFSTTQGKVWCDSVELIVLSWSASLVTAKIPDTGKGSAGGVVVEANLIRSELRLITLWSAYIYFYAQHPMSQGDDENSTAKFYLYWRYDLHSVLKLSPNREKVSCVTMSNSNDYQEDQSGPSHSTRDSGLLTDVQIDLENRKIDIDLSLRVSTFNTKFSEPGYLIDSNLNLISGSASNYSGGGVGNYTSWDSSKAQYLPPQRAIHLMNNPSIIAPKNKTTKLGTEDILLKWNPLKYMDTYHIQLSKDSLINGQRAGQHQLAVAYIVDTIVSSLDFTLPPLEKNTKYYWRVSGMNTEGESRWSDVWSFTTGTSTDVRQERANSISLSCYPNPAMNELTIVTTEPTRLLLYDVTGKIIKSEQTLSKETKWDVSLLPNGTYILGTSSGEMQVVQIVK